MKKFNYIKWVTKNKHGLLNEQWSGYNNVPFVTCFACIGGQIHATQSDAYGLVNSTATPNTGSTQGHCGWTNGYNQDWYTTQGALTAVSGSCGTGSNTGSQTVCQVSNPALALLTPNPQMGDPGISSQFVNNMAGKPINFYTNRANILQGRLNNLQTTGQYCKGENPRRQARIKNKIVYITSCSNNPGTC